MSGPPHTGTENMTQKTSNSFSDLGDNYGFSLSNAIVASGGGDIGSTVTPNGIKSTPTQSTKKPISLAEESRITSVIVLTGYG